MAKSSPIPEQIEVAELLAGKAASDLLVVQKLVPDPDVSDDPIGFHAQQAVEKALKVALTLNGVDFPKTHDLDFLLALANRSEIQLPAEMAQVGWLTPWAAEFRYDDAPMESLDRKRAEAIAEFAVDWSHKLLPKTRS
ncbi:MAG TPA: HEPN domain-containing protein [Solirubrobacterales bacterium]|nr:HEPN domain-containing protein [Solirubrobacterales bacterium]